MKKGYPNPTFLQKAEGIRDKRKKRTLIILVSVCFITLILVFVASVASKQAEYAKLFPQLVGKATATTTTTEMTVKTHATTTEATTESTSEETTETTPLAPIIATVESTSETSETSVETTSNEPDVFEEGENIHFKLKYPSQTISHQQRAVNLDALKSNIEAYQKAHKDMRICYQYQNLRTNENLGIDNLDVIVPASAFNLPVLTMFYENVAAGAPSLTDCYTYKGNNDSGRSSYIAQNFNSGKKFTLRTIANYTTSYNDNIALGFIEHSIGGRDSLRERIESISCYQSYWEKTIYTDYAKKEYRGLSTSTCYDMSKFAQYLYNSYITTPKTYQFLINDMARSNIVSPGKSAFGDDSTFLHIYGRNQDVGAYTEIAIVDYKEPFVMCIYVECRSQRQADAAIADISQYTAQFVSSCYS